MKLLSGILGLTLSSVAALASANAADFFQSGPGGYKDSYVPAPLWTGFYIGANLGYAGSENNDQLANYPAYGFGGLAPDGAFGGGQIGYNWQGIWHPHLVLGIEADIEGAGVSDNASDTLGNTYSSKLDYFGTVRGRLGYAFDHALLFATGGFAYGGINNEVNVPGFADFRTNTTATGYVLGVGLEYKFTPAWSVKVEYQYIDLGKNDPVDVAFGNGSYSANGGTVRDDAFNTFRVGVNYFVGNVYAPLK